MTSADADGIRRLHDQFRSLGLVVPTHEGAEAVFATATVAAVRQVQLLAGLEPTGVVDEETDRVLAEIVASAEAPPVVEGRLWNELAVPAGEVKLRLYRYGADGRAAVVGEGATDGEGFYRLGYEADPDPASALEVRLVGEDGREVPLSAPIAAAPRQAVVNLVAPVGAVPAPSELERLTADVDQTLGGFAPLAGAVARERGQPVGNDPVGAVHRATGWDGRVLALAGAATDLAESANLDQRGVYALLRLSLPSDPEQLAAVRSEAVRVAVDRAVDAGLVTMTGDEVTGFVDEFEGFAERTRHASRPTGALSSYGEFLGATGLTDGQRQAFDRAIVDHAGDPAALWDAARAADIGESEIVRLQTEGKLALLTTQNLKLTRAIADGLLNGAADGGDGTVVQPDLRDLVDAGLHSSEAWRAKLVDVADGDDDDHLALVVPPGYRDGVNVGEAVDLYAEDLARRVRLAFPTAVVGKLVADGEIDLGGRGDLATPVSELIAKAEGLGFSFSSTPLGPFLVDHGEALVEGLDGPVAGEAVQEMERLQRLYQITPSNEALGVLAGLGVGSGLELAVLKEQELLDRYGGSFADINQLKLVYRRSQQIAAVTYGFFGISKDTGAPATAVTALPPKRRAEAVKSLVKKFPTVEELFGEQDFCPCRHCRSVLSPAAYFVDLLHMLDRDRGSGVVPFEVLRTRRPDLEWLPLTCENTNVELPMLDCANEIMEHLVAFDGLDATAVRDTGPAVTADLLAEPQYLLPEAYDRLRQARYPLGLPFDLWHETVQAFLARVDVEPVRLLDVFRRSDLLFASPRRPGPPSTGGPALGPRPPAGPAPYYRAEVFFDQLGLAPGEVAVLTETDPASWYTLYGYDDPVTARAALWNAKTLARRLGVTYVELVDLVQTWFVNPDLEVARALRSFGLEVLDVLRFYGADDVAPLTAPQRAAFTAKLDAATTAAKASGWDDFDAADWLDEAWATHRFEAVVLLADDDPGCSFDATTLRLAGVPAPTDPATDDSLDGVLLRLNLLVRLRQRLDWPLAELDLALSSLLPGARDGLDPAHLGEALRTALVYLAHVHELAERFGPRLRHRLDLVTLWGPMPTRGPASTYARLFLRPQTGRLDPVFDHPTGDYLTDPAATLAEQQTAVQGALSMSATDVATVCTAAGLDPTSIPLSMPTVSLLYRHALLARSLGLPVPDVVALRALSGLDPLHALHADQATGRTIPLPVGPDGTAADHPCSGTVAFADLVSDLREAGTSVDDADYLLRHRFDPVGPMAPDPQAAPRLARQLASGIRALDEQLQAITSPDAGDSASVGDAGVFQALGLALPGDVAARVTALWQGQAAFTASAQDVAPDDRIDPERLTAYPEVAVAHDADDGIQHLTYRGFPVLERTRAIKSAYPGALLGKLLDQVATEADQERRATFAHLVHDADVTPLFRPPPDVSSLTATAATTARQQHERTRVAYFVEHVMPRVAEILRRRLAVTTVRQSLGREATGVAAELLDAFLTDTKLLSDPDTGQPLADRMVESAQATADPDSAVATTALRRFSRLRLLYGKAVTLVAHLMLTEREVRHLRRWTGDFGGFDLAALPTTALDASAEAPQFAAFRRLVAYTRLRTEMVDGRADLIDVFDLCRQPPADRSALAAAGQRIGELTRREPATVTALARHLQLVTRADPGGRGLADERGLRRLWDAMVLVQRLGIDPDTAVAVATPRPDAAVARRWRDAVKASFAPDAWRSIAQAINDPLRRSRRDALVAYLLHLLGLDRVEQLYENLLLDPATEPVVRTTRMRLAISSVQLFIQRCLLNLEADVPADAIDRDQAATNRRYRVWEANRTIFLFPENWLAPELRDDQTHLFGALLGALTQGDLAEDQVEAAFVAYLRGLAEIARLEIVSLWAEPDPAGPEGSTLYVLGRDHNSPRQYFHRTFSSTGWTPWTPVGAQIEGDDVATIVYRGRLHIFWLTRLVKAADAGQGANKVTQVAAATLDALKRYDLQAQLHWTELVGDHWTPPASSDVLTIATTLTEPEAFPWSNAGYTPRAWVAKDLDAGGRDRSVTIHLQHPPGSPKPESPPATDRGLRFVSRQGRPQVVEDLPWSDPSTALVKGLQPAGHHVGRLELDTGQLAPGAVLGERRPASVTEAPAPVPVGDARISRLVSPLFYADREATLGPESELGPRLDFTTQNTFFVQPQLTAAQWAEYEGTFATAVPFNKYTLDAVQVSPVEASYPLPVLTLATGQVVTTAPEPIDPSAALTIRPPNDWALGGDQPILVGDLPVAISGLAPTSTTPGRS